MGLLARAADILFDSRKRLTCQGKPKVRPGCDLSYTSQLFKQRPKAADALGVYSFEFQSILMNAGAEPGGQALA